MSEVMMAKLRANIERTNQYPPIIVRKLSEERYQILDGHHRVHILEQLGRASVECDVWNATDEQAALYLATLNTIHGEEDKDKRNALLIELANAIPIPELKMLVPESGKQLVALLDLNALPECPVDPKEQPDVITTMTFKVFKTQEHVIRQALERVRERAIENGFPSCNDATALEFMAAEVLASA